MSVPRLTLRSIRAVGVLVPMKLPLGTSATTIREAPLLLVDVETEEAITGRSYLFCYLPPAAPAIAGMLAEIERFAKGETLAPAAMWDRLAARFRLIGVQGIVRMAMAGFDMACWDALAIAAGKPLVDFLGGSARPIPAYNSNGLGLMDAGKLADEAEALAADGFRAVKLRLGYPTLEADLAAIRAVRKRLPEAIAVPVDFNQALSIDEAIRRGRALDGEGVYWIEEPIRHDDYRGNARVARELSTPVQIGENFSLPHAMEEALAAKACDYVMPDLERIGGVTGWQRAAALAAAAGIPMSSHLFPEASAHLLAATPSRHWLEFVDWANPVLAEPLRVENGSVLIPVRPGTGISWDDKAVERYRMP